MAKIIGIIVVFASVLGGYVLSHGKIGALIQPFEVLIIGGAAFGAFLQANPDIAENVEAQVREKLLQVSGAPKAPAKAAERPVAVSADDFDDED